MGKILKILSVPHKTVMDLNYVVILFGEHEKFTWSPVSSGWWCDPLKWVRDGTRVDVSLVQSGLNGWAFNLTIPYVEVGYVSGLLLTQAYLINLSLCNRQGSGDFWAQPAKIRPFTTSTGFFRIWPVANLLPLIWIGQNPFFSFLSKMPANFFFTIMTTSQELGHW